jgi:hypothetical protein
VELNGGIERSLCDQVTLSFNQVSNIKNSKNNDRKPVFLAQKLSTRIEKKQYELHMCFTRISMNQFESVKLDRMKLKIK